MLGAIAAALLVLASAPSVHIRHAAIDERRSISHSISDCIRDRYTECAAFKTDSVAIGPAVTYDYYLALADWRSIDGKRRGQVFLTTKGCGIWDVELVSMGRPLTSQAIGSFLNRGSSSDAARGKQAGIELTAALARIDAASVAYLRVPPGQSC